MAQVNYVFEGPEDNAQCYLFKNKKKADAKAEELRADEEFMMSVEDGAAILEVGSVSYREGFAVLYGSDYWPGEVKAMSADEFRGLIDEYGSFAYYTGVIKDGTECYLDERGNDYKGTQPTIAISDNDFEIGESVKTNFKYVPTFESFIGSQKVNENFTLLDAFDEYGWSDEYDGKYFPITNALNGLMDDLVWITDNFPDFIQEEGKLVKKYQMDGLDSPEDYDGEEIEDPHGDVDFSLYKYKGLKIGWFTDDYGYSAGLCHERDVKKWTKIIKDMGEEEYLDVF